MDETAARRARAPIRRRVLVLLLGCGLLAVAKLWLVFPDEIVARANPLDQQRYAEMVQELAAGHWFGAYDANTLIRRPGYPLWVALTRATGVPLRHANELLLIAAASLFVGVLFRLGQPGWLCLGSFAWLVLQPHSLAVNRELLAASFYLPLLLVALSGLLMSIAATRVRRASVHAAWGGLALGALWCTRSETPLVAMLPFLAAIWAAGTRRARGDSWPAACLRAAVLIGIAFAGIAAVGAGLSGVNRRHYGVATVSDLSAEGFAAANRALLSIEHTAPRRYVPVPVDVRRRAYAASPAFAELAETLETRGWAQAATCHAVGVCDDLGGGWFIWWLREAAQAAGQMRTAAAGEAFFGRVADELQAACDRGELRCRRPLLNFLHPVPSTYTPHLWASLGRVVARIASFGDARDRDLAGDPPDTPPAIRRLFDDAAGRRPRFTSNGRAQIRGVVWSETDRVASVTIVRGHGEAGTSPRIPNPGATEQSPGGHRFSLNFEKPTRTLAAMRPLLRVQLGSGERVALALPGMGESVAGDGLRVAIDEIRESGADDARRRGLRGALWTGHAVLLRVVTLFAAAALLVLAWPPWRGPFSTPAGAAVAMIAALSIGRVALLSLIDASSFSARSSRYVYPMVSLYGVATLMLVRGALVRLRTGWLRRPAAPRR